MQNSRWTPREVRLAGRAAPITGWKRLLAAAVVLNLIGGVVSWVTEGVTPSWIVYPILLVVGIVLFRKGGTKGTMFLAIIALLFLLIHIPFTAAAFSSNCTHPANAARDCHPLEWVISLFIVPLITVAVAVAVWLQSRKGQPHENSTPKIT